MEQEQFKKEVVPLRSQLIFYAQKLLEKEDAEDIVQEVFLKLWYMRNNLDQYNNIPALAVQITKHLCLNRLKILQRSYEQADNQSLVSTFPEPHTRLEQHD